MTKEVGQWIKLEDMNLIMKGRRLRWLGHVLRMKYYRIPKQAIHWQVDKRKPGRRKKNEIDTRLIRQDLKSIGIMTSEDCEQSATNREDWRQSVAQCVNDMG